ncbi:MAG: PAS domain S-box protein [Aphanocapsa sp. GSE-SYN-MK-11-07L]|nr:PAS domain S-box protein [Aphanocapsa sp. GSE-SYN-MK-11-07L]
MISSKHEQPSIKHLLIVEDRQGRRTIILESATCTIGRDSSNSIVLDSPLISRHHATLLRVTLPGTSNHLFRIIDGNLQGSRSANGLVVNGQCTFSHDLQHGDVIVMGDVKSRYYGTRSLSDVMPLTSGETEDVSGFLSNLTNPFQTLSTVERNLEENNEAALVRLASFPELLANPIVEIDLAGNITYLNPAAINQFPNIRTLKLQHPILLGLIDGVVSGWENRFDREVKIAEQVFEQSIHYIAASELIRIHIEDITNRKQAERSIRFQANVLAQVNDAVIAVDVVNCVTYWNERAAWLYDLTSEEALGKNLDHAYQRRWLNLEDQQTFEHALATQGVWRGENIHIKRTRETIHVESSNSVLKDEDGNVIGVLSVIRDVSDRKRSEAEHQRAEAALQQAHDQLELRVEQRTAELSAANQQLQNEIEERQRAEAALQGSFATNRALLNAIPDWIFRITEAGTIVNCKASHLNLLPLTTDEFLGKTLDQVLPPDVAEPMIGCVVQALLTGEVQIFEYQLLLQGRPLDFEARIAVSAEWEVMAIIRDITERKRVETDIRKALEKEKELSELKTRFVAMASHEFRTPLATILSSAQLLEHYGHKWGDEKQLGHLHRIQAAVRHMAELMNDVLLLGKAEAGKLEFQPRLLDLVQFCQEMITAIQLNTPDCTIEFRIYGEYLKVWIDEKLLRHILENLLSNAIKYSPQCGIVNFNLIYQLGQVIFRIQDLGIGIPEADLAQLFNSFTRATNVGNISGTGLGLVIVKKAVDLHGGTISVESQVGVGTTFTVTIPYHQQGETNDKNFGD